MNLIQQFLEQAQSLKPTVQDKWLERESLKDTFQSDLALEVERVKSQYPELTDKELEVKATTNLFEQAFKEVLNHLENELTDQEKEGKLEVFRTLNLTEQDIDDFAAFLDGKAEMFQQYAGLGNAWNYKNSQEDLSFADNKKETIRVVLKGQITINNIDVLSTIMKNLISLFDKSITLIEQSDLELVSVYYKNHGSPEIIEHPINQAVKA